MECKKSIDFAEGIAEEDCAEGIAEEDCAEGQLSEDAASGLANNVNLSVVTDAVWGEIKGNIEDQTDLMQAIAAASGGSITAPAGEVISALRCILTLGGQAYTASSNDPDSANAILGISTNAVATIRQPVTIQASGAITDASFNWVDKKPIFCGPDGSLTQFPPATGFIQQVAIPKSEHSLEVSLKIATIRA